MTVSGETAQRHELYGVGGWLAWFAITIALGLLRDLGSISGEASKIGMSLVNFLAVDHPAVSMVRWVLAIEVAMLLAIYYMMAMKAPFFRLATTWILVGVIPAVFLLGTLYPFEGVGEVLAQTVFVQVLYCIIWCSYLNLSKRVRVTFEHRVLRTTEQAVVERDSGVEQHSVEAVPPIASVFAAEPHAASTVASDVPGALVQPPDAYAMAHSPETSNIGQTLEPDNDEQLWELAAQEFDGPARRAGLWAKSFAQSGGDEVQAKINYLKVRVSQLVAERAVRRQAGAVALRTRRDAETLADDAKPAALPTQNSRSPVAPPRPSLGVCPSCSNTISVDSRSCPKCKASFDEYSSWRVKPLGS